MSSALGQQGNVRFADAARYERHRPEHTLLYQFVERHYPAFLAELEVQSHSLPSLCGKGFDGFLKCGRFEIWLFCGLHCETCHASNWWF